MKQKSLLAIPHEHSQDALYPPVGLLYLAAAVRHHGYEVKVLDGQIVGDEAILKEFEPAVIQNQHLIRNGCSGREDISFFCAGIRG